MTDKGRELLSKNQLNFSYYAFSDEGIDYSGSLQLTNTNFSGSIDEVVFRNLSFESTQKRNQDLSSFLYTIDSREKKVPEFTSDTQEGTITLERNYFSIPLGSDLNYVNHIIYSPDFRNSFRKPLDIVFRVKVDEKDKKDFYIKLLNIARIVPVGNTSFFRDRIIRILSEE